MICAEYIDYMNAYRVYDADKPQWTWAYADTLEEAEQIAKEENAKLQVVISL